MHTKAEIHSNSFRTILKPFASIIFSFVLLVSFVPVGFAETAFASDENQLSSDSSFEPQMSQKPGKSLLGTSDSQQLTYGSYTSSSCGQNEQVWFKFKTKTNMPGYRISLSNNGSSNLKYSIYIDNSQYYSNTEKTVSPYNSGTIVADWLNNDQWYYVVVENTGTSTAYFSITLEDISNYSKTLTLGTKYSSESCSSSGSKWYKFKTTGNNAFYRITFNNRNGGIINSSIWCENYSNYYKSFSYSISSYSDKVFLAKLKRNTWYYFKVEAPHSAAYYSVTVQQIRDQGGENMSEAPSIGMSYHTGDLLESDNGYLGGGYLGYDDSDWYKFVVPRDGNYDLKTWRDSGDSFDKYLNRYAMTVYNRDGDRIDDFSYSYSHWSDGGNYTMIYAPMRNIKKGTVFYIKIYDGQEDPTPYYFQAVYLKKTNPMTAKAKTVTAKYRTLKKRSQTIKRSKAMAVRKAKGTVTYKKLSVSKKRYAKKIVVKKNGTIVLKKGLKKGTYKVRIRVRAAGDSTYKAKNKNITVKIRVK